MNRTRSRGRTAPRTTDAQHLANLVSEASERVRLAGRATYDVSAPIPDLTPALAAVIETVDRLPQLVRFLRRQSQLADPARLSDDQSIPTSATLDAITSALCDAVTDLDRAHMRLGEAHVYLGHLAERHPRDRP